MRSSIEDLPVIVDSPAVTIRAVKWGDMMVEVGDSHLAGDTSAANFKGLPDDRCQCPHWGYVIKGQMRFKYADREEVYSAGDLFFMPPGHVPVSGEGCQWLDFSPSDEYSRTMEVIIRNAKSRQ
ncbi:MAG: AraC family ligand binding domain-containing protein [Bacteroidota bacterium]